MAHIAFFDLIKPLGSVTFASLLEMKLSLSTIYSVIKIKVKILRGKNPDKVYAWEPLHYFFQNKSHDHGHGP